MLSAGVVFLCFKEVRRLLVGIVVDPFTEMIGEVKGSVVVGAILKIDGHQAVTRVAGDVSKQNVSLLQVIVAKGHRRVNFEQEFPEKNN